MWGPVPFADGELSWARVPTSPPAKRPQILRLAQPSSAGTYCAWRAPHQSSAGTTSRRCRPRSGTSVGRPQPCSCPGSSPPPAGARRLWRTPLEPTSALGCISAMACQGHQGSPSSSWPLRDVSSNGNSPPRMGERGVPVTHSKEPSLLATLYSERSVSSPGSRILPAWPQSQRRLRDARKGRAGQVPTLHPRGTAPGPPDSVGSAWASPARTWLGSCLGHLVPFAVTPT